MSEVKPKKTRKKAEVPTTDVSADTPIDNPVADTETADETADNTEAVDTETTDTETVGGGETLSDNKSDDEPTEVMSEPVVDNIPNHTTDEQTVPNEPSKSTEPSEPTKSANTVSITNNVPMDLYEPYSDTLIPFGKTVAVVLDTGGVVLANLKQLKAIHGNLIIEGA